MTSLARLSATASAAALALALAACGDDRAGEGTRTAVTEDQIEEGLDALGVARSDLFAAADVEIEDGVAVYTGLTSTDEDAPGRVGRVSIGAPRVEDGVTRFDWLEAEDLLAGGEGGDGVSRIARLRADRPGPALSQLISDVINGRTDSSDYQLPSRSSAGYTFAELSMSGLSFSDGVGDGEAAGGEMARLALEDFDGERLGRAVIEGLSITGQDPDAGEFVLRMDEFALTGLDALFVDVLLNMDEEGGFSAMGDRFGDAMANLMRPTGAYETFVVRGMEMRASGLSVGMPLFDSRYETRRDGTVDIIAAMPSLTVAFSPDNPEMAQAGQMLASIGYETLDFEFNSRSHYNPQTDRVTGALDENWFEMKDGLRIAMAQDVTGLQAYADATAAVMSGVFAAIEEDPEGAEALMEERLMDAYGELQVHSMTIRIDDLDLLERAMTLNAQMQGVSPEEARMQAATMLGLGIAMGGGMLPEGVAIEIGAALSAFINQGGAVEITLNPASPVGMDRLMNVAEDMSVLRDLGLSVRHIPAE
ncbi:MAG: hypothetical protein LAT81_01375 [Oceanicaulis sp.]|nr:hypothetical protein [Oceanicaulis sp.]